MSTTVVPPDPQVLIPQLLAFLPTSFASAKPPPALLSLVSPILQQRLQIHTSSPGNAHDSWLRLLCWDKTKAEQLKDTVENATFEPHPSSGEMEVGDVETIVYKRFDAETLRAQIPLPDWELTAMYLWCEGGNAESGWKLAELLPFDSDLITAAGWTATLEQVTAARPVSTKPPTTKSPHNLLQRKVSAQSDDDSYWAMYDATPGRTPARQGSVNPQLAALSEEDYYAQYEGVQPALDNEDPDEVQADIGQSSLDGNVLQQVLPAQQQTSSIPPNLPTIDTERSGEDDDVVHIDHPVPSSPSSRASDTISRLEDSASRYSASDIAIRQHISTSMKSMYRLAKAAGIGRDDFDLMVQRELETLSLFDANE